MPETQRRIQELFSTGGFPVNVPLEDCVAETPTGFSNTAGYWKKHMWQALEFVDDYVSAMTRECQELLQAADEEGVEVLHVAPSIFATACGFISSRAFPDTFLAAYYARNC